MSDKELDALERHGMTDGLGALTSEALVSETRRARAAEDALTSRLAECEALLARALDCLASLAFHKRPHGAHQMRATALLREVGYLGELD